VAPALTSSWPFKTDMTDDTEQIRTPQRTGRLYAAGGLALGLLNVLFAFAGGRLLGYREAELVGYSLGPAFLGAIVLGIAAVVTRARRKGSRARWVFFTQLVILFPTFSGAMQALRQAAAPLVAIEPESLRVEESKALSIVRQIQDAVSNNHPDSVRHLYNADRFVARALEGENATSGYWRSVARGASRSFAENQLLRQMATFTADRGEFAFVKFYKRQEQPLIQFRLVEASGNLHYVDFYVFKDKEGNLGIDDARYYNSGDILSAQVVETASMLGELNDLELLRNSMKLAREGKSQEAWEQMESIPDDVKLIKPILRLRLQLANQTNLSQAEPLLKEFKTRFPDDSSIVFSDFSNAIVRDDVESAARLIEDVYKAVEGDNYLLWYKVRLLAAAGKNSDALRVLTEMKTRYKIPVDALAGSELPDTFLSSDDYKTWARAQQPIRTSH
jgi:hypothetical protein